MSDSLLMIRELYPTLQGEGPSTGVPATFVRLSGCSLRCTWCDSAHAFQGGDELTVDAVVAQVREGGRELAVVTGGEPLDQSAVHPLMAALVASGHKVELETGGHKSLEAVPRGVHIHMDLKAPSSGMERRNRWANLAQLTRRDLLKIVIASREDYLWVRDVIRERWETCKAPLWLSPAFPEGESEGLSIPDLANWIIEDQMPVRLGVQMHKVLWSDPVERPPQS